MLENSLILVGAGIPPSKGEPLMEADALKVQAPAIYDLHQLNNHLTVIFLKYSQMQREPGSQKTEITNSFSIEISLMLSCHCTFWNARQDY